MLNRWRWIFYGIGIFAVVAGGLLFGKFQDKGRIDRLYERKSFTLLDDSGEFFELAKYPADKFLLLIFTPDAIPTQSVGPMYDFTKKSPVLEKLGIEVVWITRTNREIVRNFKEASGFKGRLLIDMSGTSGNLLKVWPGAEPVSHWGYVLTDSQMKVYWGRLSPGILSFEELRAEIGK